MGKVNDRGTIKWTAMMMPEQIKMLNEMWAQQERKEKPILDEQQIEDNAMRLQMAIHNDLSVEVKHFKNNDFHKIKGKLSSIVFNETIVFDNEERTKINFSDVIDVVVD